MPRSTLSEEQLLDKEKDYIRHMKKGDIQEDDLFGLAISGGGIRSTSFALGALQALDNKNLLKKLHYMSTVSGGGYIGSCLTWFLHKIHSDKASEELDQQALSKKERGVRSTKKNDVLSYLRQHGNYLTPGNGLDTVSMLAVVLRSMFLGFVVYFPLLVAFFFGLQKGCHLLNDKLLIPHSLPSTTPSIILLALAVLFMLLFALLAIISSFCSYLGGGNTLRSYRKRICVQGVSGNIVKAVVLLTVLGVIPLLVDHLDSSILPALSSGGFTLLGALGGFFKLLSEQRPQKGPLSKLTSFIPEIAAILLIYGLLVGAYLFANFLTSPLWFLGLAVIIAIGLLANINYVAPHRMYRDRLMEMFLPNRAMVARGKWGLASTANTTTLAQLAAIPPQFSQTGYPGPYHLINCNLIQVDAKQAKYRGRGGDSFILSPLFCGSDATGWCASSVFNGGTMTLATAMAISGAAVNPHAGPAGRGPTRKWLVSFLMSFLNLRLGYWARNPARENDDSAEKQSQPAKKRKKYLQKMLRPNYLWPGLTAGLFGQGYSEKAEFIELSDGGHFENLGLYELIRRRVRTIIVTDAGADPQFNFSDLSNAVEKARVDFGVDIDFYQSKKPISDLLPGSADELSLYRDKYCLAKSGYAIAKIKYPPRAGEQRQMIGYLYYIKSTLTGGLPEDIYGYKSHNPSFPDQSTSDQFFDERQFEAYRELGYHLTKKMLKETPYLR